MPAPSGPEVRGVAVSPEGHIVLQALELPERRDGCLTIAAVCSLISPGTELHYIRRAAETGRAMPLGYCSAGYVEAVPPGVSSFQEGDRVVAMGWGAALHAERIFVPWRLCCPIPDQLSFERAVFAAISCTAFHALDRSACARGETVLLVGAGLVGQMIVQCARARGIGAVVVDRVAGRVAAALEGGAVFGLAADNLPWARRLPYRFGCAFLAISGRADEAFSQSLSALRTEPNGRPIGCIVIVGRIELDMRFSVELGNVDIRNSAHAGYGYRDDNYVRGHVDYCSPPIGQNLVDTNLRMGVSAIAEGLISTDHIHTHRFAFEQAADAYDLLLNPQSRAIGVTLSYTV